jgi:peptidoglycan/LPS O-acetylase OafA/YrhL
LGKKALRFLLPMLWIGLLFTYTNGKDWMAFIADRYKQGYWYLYILTLFYLLMYVFGKLPKVKRSWLLDIAYLAFWQVAFVAADRVLGQDLSDMTGISMCRGYWIYFFLGYMARRYGWTEWLSEHNWLFTLTLVTFVPLLYAYGTGLFVRFGQVLPLTAIIVLVFLFRRREHETSRVEQSLSAIGRSTLDIYIFHYFVLRIIDLTDVASYLHHSFNYLLELVMLIAMALIVSGVCITVGKVLRQSDIIRIVVYGELIKRK